MLRRRLLELYPLLLLAAIWEMAARSGLVRPLFLPPLSTILAGMPGLLSDGDLAGPLLTSLYRAVAGLAVAMIVGLVTGLMIARVRWARLLFGPLVAFGSPAPKIALLPVFIAWFGIGHFSKIVLVAVTAVFPFILAAQAGAEAVPVRQIWAARAMGTSGPRAVLARRHPRRAASIAERAARCCALRADHLVHRGDDRGRRRTRRHVGHGATVF